MKSVLTSFAIILFTSTFLTEISCCSDNASDIIDLIARDPEYRFDPCYIKWNAKEEFKKKVQREKLERQYLEQEERIKEKLERRKLEKEEHRKKELEEERKQEELQRNRRSHAAFVVAKWVGLIVCACAGIGCCAAIIHFSERETTDTENDGFTALSTSSGIASNTRGNQTNVFPSTVITISTPTAPEMEYERSSPFHSLSSFPTQNAMRTIRENIQPEAIAPLVQRGVYRQNSLPSYDDVIRMTITYPLPK